MHLVMFLILGIFIPFLSGHASSLDQKSIGISHPATEVRFIFVSPVDDEVWGIVCPGQIQDYQGRSTEENRNCRARKTVGPVNRGLLLRNLPLEINREAFDRHLLSDKITPVYSNRDSYFEVWDLLVDLVNGPIRRPPTSYPSECGEDYPSPYDIKGNNAQVELLPSFEDIGERSISICYALVCR